MARLTLEQVRALIGERVGKYSNDNQNDPVAFAATPPPQLIEAMVDLETGGTYDPELVQPESGATGLGQIVPGGAEWSDYVAAHGREPNLTDPAENLDVMIEGLAARRMDGNLARDQGRPGAYEDWYMAAAGYLGGATEEGFNGASDSLGTSGPDYVRRVRQYITATWGAQTAADVDLLGRGAAVATGDDWAAGEIVYDPDAPAAARPKDLLDKLLAGISDVIGKGTNAVTDVAGQVLSGLLGALGAVLPRAGAVVAGLGVAAIGVLVLARGGGLGRG